MIFPTPDQDRYLEIVEGIAARRGLLIDREQLQRAALNWECWHNGRSPRSARQFVDWLEGRSRARRDGRYAAPRPTNKVATGALWARSRRRCRICACIYAVQRAHLYRIYALDHQMRCRCAGATRHQIRVF